MKANYLFLAMALPIAFTACTNEFEETSIVSPIQDGELISLPENYTLSGVLGNNTEMSRAIYNGTSFAWLPTNGVNDAIGLCWVGGEYTANSSVVYTNYKFEHFGWLGKNEAVPVFDCEGKLSNGQLVKDLDENQTKLLNGTWNVANNTTYPNLKVDAKNGLFNTSNSTIFKGDYIVYYPYNDKFAEVGNIPATIPVNIKRNVHGLTDNNYTTELANEVFVAGTMNGVEGGQQNGVFSTNFVSGGIVVKITNNSTKEGFNVHKVILLSDNGFITEAKLDASKIAAGAKGSALYAEEPTKFENALVAEFYNSNNGGKQADLSVGVGGTERVAFSVLPTTSSTKLQNAKVILVDKNGQSAVFDANLSDLKSLSEGWNVIDVNVKADSFTDAAYAYDTESLVYALTQHSEAEGKGQNINVLNTIKLDPNYKFSMPYGDDSESSLQEKFDGTDKSFYIKENLTISGKGSIVVPANLKLVFKSVGTEQNPANVKFEVPVTIENIGCCGKYNGTVTFRTASTEYGKFELSKIVNEGTLYLGNDKNGTVDIKVTELINNGGLVNVYNMGKSNVTVDKLSNTFVESYTEKTNNGRINVVAKFQDPTTGKKVFFTDEEDADVVTLNVNELTNSKDAYVLVGKRTNLNIGTANNNGRIKIETAALTSTQQCDGELCVNTSLDNAGQIENYGVLNNLGYLANKGVIVDHIGSLFGAKQITNVENGQYICDVEDVDGAANGDRLGYAMGENMPTTTIRFVGEAPQYGYNLDGYKTDNVLPYNFIVETNKPVRFYAKKEVEGSKVVCDVKIAGTLEVNQKLTLNGIHLTVGDEVKVNETLNVQPDIDTKLNTVDVLNANSLIVNKGAEFNVESYAKTNVATDMVISEDAEATFAYNSYSNIVNLLDINGTFTRKLSSGSNSSNPAQVWCGSFKTGSKAVITNAYPQTR